MKHFYDIIVKRIFTPEEIYMISVDIVREKLSVGMILKNFKALCDILGEDANRGASRMAQIKDFKR